MIYLSLNLESWHVLIMDDFFASKECHLKCRIILILQKCFQSTKFLDNNDNSGSDGRLKTSNLTLPFAQHIPGVSF